MSRTHRLLVTALLGASALTGSAQASNFTAAQILGQFDAVIGTTINSAGGDINGPWVVGGNVVTNGNTISVNPSGNGTPIANPTGALAGYGVVNAFGTISGGGAFNVNNSAFIFNMGGTTTTSFNGGATVHTSSTLLNGTNFTTAFYTPMTTLTTTLANMVANNNINSYISNSSLRIGTTTTANAQGFAVFNISASTLAGLSNGIAVNPTSAQTVVIDVTGLTGSSNTFSLNYNGGDGTTAAQNVIWDFGTYAGTITLGNWNGTILAPDATVSQNNGQIDGTLVANVWNQGTNELHNDQLSSASLTAISNLSGTVTKIPEPASMAVLGLGLAGLYRVRRRRA